MDFTAEIAGAQRLATLASEQSDALPHLRRLGFPDYFSGFSNERLLVSGFVEGNTLAEWLDSGGLPYEALLDLFRIHGYFLFVRGEFHGDLHPGNVIWHEGNFWFLDNANIETVPPQFGRGIFQMMVLLGQGDLPRAADQLAALSLKPLGASQLAGFRSQFNALYQDFSGRTVAETSLTDQMMKTVKMAVHSGVTFPRGAFPLIKSLMYLDGMVLRAAPQAKLLRDVARFADDFPAEG
jgi:ubiquinone biosynthesis protein